MPTFQGLVSEEQLLELIEYVKSLKRSRRCRPRSPSRRPAGTPSEATRR